MDRENNCKIEAIDLSDDTTVATGNNDQLQYLIPDVGYIYQIIHINYQAPVPAGGSSGNHYLYFGHYIDSVERAAAYIIQVFGSILKIAETRFVGSAEVPSTEATQQSMLKDRLWCSHDNPIYFRYRNGTDVDQTGTRTLIILVKKFREAI